MSKLTTSGKIVVDDTGIRVILDYDFGRYYKWIIDNSWTYHCKDLALPKHGIHITILNVKLHRKAFMDNKHWLKNQYHGKKVDVIYDNLFHEGGSDFTNYMLWCELPIGDRIRREVRVKTDSRWHITICNDKSAARPLELLQRRNGTIQK